MFMYPAHVAHHLWNLGHAPSRVIAWRGRFIGRPGVACQYLGGRQWSAS